MTETFQSRESVVKLFGAQYDAFNFTTQFGAAVAGVQSGKTLMGAYWAGKKISEFPHKNGIIAAPTYNILRAATLKKFFDVFPYLRAHYKEQKGEIQLPGGGVIYVRSADNPLGIEGITAHWAWLDEGGMCSLLTWTVLRSRVSMTGGQILITTTPYNMGWLYQDFYQPWRDGTDKNLSFFTWRSIDNPHYPKDFYEAERLRLPPEEFARRYMGEFRKMTGLVWDIPVEAIIAPIEGLAQKADARLIGIDWAFVVPSAIAVVYRYESKWYVAAEWKKAEQTTKQIVQVANNMLREHNVDKVYPDPAEPDRVEELKKEGLPIYETKKYVIGGISLIRELIYQKKFFVYNNCKEFIDEASMYHYAQPKEGREGKETPEKVNDHLCDAVRYAIYSYHDGIRKFGGASSVIQPFYVD